MLYHWAADINNILKEEIALRHPLNSCKRSNVAENLLFCIPEIVSIRPNSLEFKYICAPDTLETVRSYHRPNRNTIYETEGAPTHVILMVDYGVMIAFAVVVSVHGFYMIRAISCMDGSLKLTLKHRTIAGRITFA